MSGLTPNSGASKKPCSKKMLVLGVQGASFLSQNLFGPFSPRKPVIAEATLGKFLESILQKSAG